MLSVDNSNIDGPPLAVKCVRKFGSVLRGEVTAVCVCVCVCVARTRACVSMVIWGKIQWKLDLINLMLEYLIACLFLHPPVEIMP